MNTASATDSNKDTKFLPNLPPKFEYRVDLRHYVTPRLLRQQPIHNWFMFPHSFSPQLIDKIFEEYPLQSGGKLLDPFVGAGTAVLRAKQLGFSAMGSDLSPLSIFVSKAKIQDYNRAEIDQSLEEILNSPFSSTIINTSIYPERTLKAFTMGEISKIEALRQKIQILPDPLNSFFMLALLTVQQSLSRAVPDGGWFRWVDKPSQSRKVLSLFKAQTAKQRNDVREAQSPQVGTWEIIRKDAREVNTLGGQFDYLITSPPYPNRHDYSRIFHMELLSLGQTEKEIFQFRHSSIRSHVEARRPKADYKVSYQSQKLETTLDAITSDADPRIVPMLRGYFDDMYLCLSAAHMVLKPDAPVVFVVGNVRHGGVMVPVDEILAEIGEQAGYTFECGWVARLRGNSAQQMASYGREPSRETVVIFKR